MKKLLFLFLIFAIILTSICGCSSNNNDTTEDTPTIHYAEGYYDYEIVETGSKVDFSTITGTNDKAVVTCKTDKDPYSYKVGEEITFNFSFRSRSKYASCDWFKVELRFDGIEEIKTFYVDGSSGQFKLFTAMSAPGFVMAYVYPCNAQKKVYSDTVTEYALCGAGADIEKIAHNGEEPADFDAYWQTRIDDLLKIDPEILQFEFLREQKGCNIYNIKIKCVDDSSWYSDGETHNYVAGVLSVPKDASAKSLGISMYFNGHGIYKCDLSDYMISSDMISINVNAHAFDCVNANINIMKARLNGAYGYGMYYVGETNPDNVYYKNMILRNLQALRFLTTYYGGGEGGDLFNGTIEIQGGSQGGFQAAAVTGLASKMGITVTKCKLSFPWLCDMGSYCKDSTTNVNAMVSNWYPQGPYSVLAYFDSVFFARRITCKANVNVGLGDITTPAKGVTALYNELGTENKAMTYYQNRSHGVTNSKQETFVINGKLGQ